MKNSERPKPSKREDEVDFISNMPDHILLLILSRLLCTEKVIRTSILSTRWRYLWTSIPSLHLYCYKGNLKKNNFEEFMGRVLVKLSGDLDNFHLCCVSYSSMSTVGRWIHVAVTKNVKQLDLMFCPKEEDTGDIELPHCLVTCGSLKELSLKILRRGLRLPNIMGFPALRVLSLTYVDLLDDDELIKDFFQSCPLLEDLSLFECSISKLDFLCISCQKLKKFQITGDGVLCGGIKICCPRLFFLKLRGDVAYNYVIECLDSLKEAQITPNSMGNTISMSFSGISHVKSLLIDLYFFTQCIKAASHPGLPNLKTLTLTTTIDAFTFHKFIRILKYYPKLESLNLITRRAISPDMEASQLYEGDLRRILSPDVNRVKFFEFKGERPKLVPNWIGKIFLTMIFIWSNKGKYSH